MPPTVGIHHKGGRYVYQVGHGPGTSFGAPQVAGAAALLVDINKKMNESLADGNLRSSARTLAPALGLGAGELDLYQACLAAKKGK